VGVAAGGNRVRGQGAGRKSVLVCFSRSAAEEETEGRKRRGSREEGESPPAGERARGPVARIRWQVGPGDPPYLLPGLRGNLCIAC